MSQSINQGTNTNAGATLNGLFRQIYAKEVKNLIPDFCILQKRLPFSKAALLGDNYHLPVVVADEHGFTYGGNSGLNYTLNNAIAMQMQDAQIPGSELTLQSGISYGAVSRAQNKGETAVEQAVRILMERMKASAAKRVEIELIYGASPTGLAQITTATSTSTSAVLTISSQAWASGIWSGMENAQLDSYYVNAGVSTQNNTNSPYTVSKVDPVNYRLTVTGNATDIGNISANLASYSTYLTFYGAYGNEMVGLDAILSNTGTLFNINATTYSLWQSNTYSCGNAEFSMGKILSGLALAVGRGLMEDVAVLLNPTSFANILSDLSAQRRFDGTYSKKKAENGFETVTFYGQNGMIELIPHAMVKNGDAFAVPLDCIQRVGSTDVAFRGEGPVGEQDYLFQNTSTNGWTCRAYTDQAILIEAPAHCVKFNSITYT
jgi:hypothetical protein